MKSLKWQGNTIIGTVLLVVFIGSVLSWKYSSWISRPNEVYISLAWDGLKNYFTTHYHVVHDSTYVRYNGMNYPFGEHELFSDNQPVLANTMQWWHRNVSDLGGSVIGIINIVQLLSVVFGAVVLFWLLRRLRLPFWYSFLVGMGLCLLSPQLLRFHVHFGLSHIWIIPLLLLLLLFYEERKSKRYASLWIGIFITFVGLIHFYNFGICALIAGLYVGFTLLNELSLTNIYKRFSHLIVMVGMPFFYLNLWIRWDAYSINRTSTPWGFLEYIGQWEAVFLPYKNFPLYHWIDTAITPIRQLKTEESLSYVGVVGTLFFIFLLLSGFYVFWKKTEPPTQYRSHKPFLTKILLSTILLLLFALGIPFIIPGCDWMLDYLGPLRQFRGLGRFCWPFYYVINIVAFYSLYHYSKTIQRPALRVAAWALPLAVLFYEVQFFVKNLDNSPIEHRHYSYLYERDFKENGWLDKFDPAEFQAILPLPYQHIGSENIWMEGHFMAFVYAQITAVHTGLPDMTVMMSRTPIDQTVKSVQMVLHPTQQPAMLSEFLDERPLLVLVDSGDWETVKTKYGMLLRGAKKIVHNEKVMLFKLPLEEIRNSASHARAVAESALASAKLYPQQSDYQASSENPFFIHKDFEEGNEKSLRFQGQSALRVAYRDTLHLVKQPIPQGHYHMSLWTYALKDQGMNRTAHIIEKNSAGETVQHRYEALSKCIKTISDGWAMYELDLEFKSPDNSAEIFMVNENAVDGFYIDEFLFRPWGVDFFQQKGHQLAWNGYWYQ